MKKNDSNIPKKLARYGALAAAIAGVAEASGQVIYTDIDPDFEGTLGSSYAIDFDGDGIDDIVFNNTGDSYVYNGYYFSYSYGYNALFADPTGNNKFLGSGGSNYGYPYALSYGDVISSNALSFINAPTNSMLLKSFFNSSFYSSSNYFGNWNGVTDKYIGVKFEISGETHYGWIRLDVTEDADFTVKDYAYQATPNTAIMAGEMVAETPCEAPSNVSLDLVETESAQFSWDASEDETNGYHWAVFEQGADPEIDEPIAEGNVATGITQVNVDGLMPDTAYDFYVQTLCDDENTSNWTDALSFETMISCEPPTNITLDMVDADSAQFSWDASEDETNGYHWGVFAQGADPQVDEPIIEGNVATGVTTAMATGLELDTTYDFYIQTLCDEETISEWSEMLTFTSDIGCPIPSNVSIVPVSSTEVNVLWTENGEATAWEIEYGALGFTHGEGTLIEDTDGEIGVTLSNLSADTDYDLYLRAICDDEETSPWFGPVSFTTETAGVSLQAFKDFVVYPTPAKNTLHLQSSQNLEEVSIFNLLGKRILIEKPNQLKSTIDITNLSAGIYLMNVKINTSSKTFKIVKE